MTKPRELWDALSLGPLYVVFRRLRFPSGRTVRKYWNGNAGFTENRWKLWKTADRAAAERCAVRVRGIVAEWKP